MLVLAASGGPFATPASAHPLGNFTVNTFSGLTVREERIDVELVVDQAEIPAFQARRGIDADGDGTTGPSEMAAYRQAECVRLARGLKLAVDGRATVLAVRTSDLDFPPGQAGLSTLRLTCGLSADLATDRSERTITYSSSNFLDRVGWREITAVGDGTTLVASDVPPQSVSDKLSRYPEDLLSSPVDQRTAALRVRPGGTGAQDGLSAAGGVASPLPRGLDGATQAFTGFVSRQDLTLGFILLAILGSAALGAVHALAPGHGKTVMAAYLVAERGSAREALMIGLTVTATHTLGVLALGIAISVSAVVTPERLYPWLGLASGLILAGIGVQILMRMRHSHGEPAHTHDGPAHTHDGPTHTHPAPTHTHGGRAHSHVPAPDAMPGRGLRRRDLLAMGFVGGFLPSPSAVVVLLGAIALGRSWFGAVLVLFYGAGMAATLTAAGLLLLRGRGALDRRMGSGAWRQHRKLTLLSRAVPSCTALAIVVVGLFLAIRGGAAI